MSSISGARPGASVPGAAMIADSLWFERIAGAAYGLEIARKARVGFDLAPQPRHLHVDIADIAAELRRLRQVLARHRFAGARRQARQQPCLGGGQVHRLLTAEQLATPRIVAEGAEPDIAVGLIGDGAAVKDVANAQHQLARLERLGEI